MAPAALLPLAPLPHHPNPPRRPLCRCGASRRGFTVHTAIAIASASASAPTAAAEATSPSPPPSPPTQTPSSKPGSPVLGGIANTRSWSQYYGSGFSIRVPPSFDDILEPEDYNAGMTYYGDKAKPRAYAARFASPDRDELISVVIKPSNQLKITFLEAKDITDLGTLKEASKIFVPAGAKVFSARTIKVKEEEDIRTYYFYEFCLDKQHIALMATVNSGKTYIAGATAPEMKWGDDGVKLRSAAVSLSVSCMIVQKMTTSWDTILGFSSMHREIDYYPSHGKKVNSSICRQTKHWMRLHKVSVKSVKDFGSGYIFL